MMVRPISPRGADLSSDAGSHSLKARRDLGINQNLIINGAAVRAAVVIVRTLHNIRNIAKNHKMPQRRHDCCNNMPGATTLHNHFHQNCCRLPTAIVFDTGGSHT